MRKLTDAELGAIYVKRCCPFCAAPFASFIAGPRGAMSRNMQCSSCLAKVNVLAPEYWDRWPGVAIGELIEGPQRTPPPR